MSEPLRAKASLPTGMVTFLFTDIEGSTVLWEQDGARMSEALAAHDALARRAVEGNHGTVVKTTGDGVHAVFPVAHDGVGAAVDGQLALTSGALVVFVLGNVSDIVTLDLRGVHSQVTLWESIWFTWLSGQQVVALLAGATAFAFPLAVILLRLYVLAPLAAGRRVRGFVPAMRALRWVTRWSMVEVFLFGTLVAIVKLAGLASVVPGVGIFSFGALTLLLAAIQASGQHGLWQRAAELPR